MGDSTKLFTVFVGHLSMDTTKKDLWDLFRECGDVHETYTVQQSKEMCFKYGFVRFKDTDSARKAVRELNGWKLKGNRIVVEAAKRDASGVEQPNFGLRQTDEVVLPRSGPSKPVAVERSVPRRSHSETNADHMTGLKNLSRLKDACAVVNFDLDTHSKSGQRVDVDKLMKDINEETCSRPATQISKVYGVDCSVEIATAQLHKCRCSKSCTKDKRADDFLKSLKVIMKNINTYLENVSAKTHPVQESENSDCECHPTSTKENPAETLSKGTSHELYKPTAMIKESGLTNYHYNKAVVTTGSEESCSEELISSFNSSLSFDSSFSSSLDSSGTGFKPVSSEFTQSSTVVGVANGNISRALFTHSPEEVDLRNSSLTSKDFNFNPRTAGEGLLQSEKNVEQILSVLGRGRRLRTSYQ